MPNKRTVEHNKEGEGEGEEKFRKFIHCHEAHKLANYSCHQSVGRLNSLKVDPWMVLSPAVLLYIPPCSMSTSLKHLSQSKVFVYQHGKTNGRKVRNTLEKHNSSKYRETAIMGIYFLVFRISVEAFN
jgi:hypothetical protein